MCPGVVVHRSFEVAYGEVFGFLGPNGAREDDDGPHPGHLDRADLRLGNGSRMPLSSENGVEIRERISIMPEAPGLYLRLTVTPWCTLLEGLGRAPASNPMAGVDHVGARIFAELYLPIGQRSGDGRPDTSALERGTFA